MRDSEFKRLAHNTGDLRVATSGSTVCEGYKPDVTLRDEEERLIYILECEQKTDRKAFIGDLIKAEYLAHLEQAQPTLLIVMREFKNTTVQQISNQLAIYQEWLRDRLIGGTCLSAVWVVSDISYKESVLAGETIGDIRFMKRIVAVFPAQQPVQPYCRESAALD